MTDRRRAWVIARIVAFVAVTVAVIAAARTVDWSRAIGLLATTHPAWVIAGIIANAGILVCWASFWRALRADEERPISFSRSFEVVATSSSLMNTVPFGGGHASSVLVLITRGETTQRGAVSLFALDQVGEGITKIGIFLLVGVLVPLPAWMRAGIVSASIAVAVLLVVVIVASRWASELRILGSVKKTLIALCSVVGMKAVQGVAIAAVQHAFGLDIALTGTLLVLAAIVMGTMVPLAPGNLGTYEASAFVAYRYLGLAPEQALSVAIMQHVCFMIPSIGVGYLYVSARTFAKRAIASR
jgi:uncharacterized membrane protein YbhN (UPF0104 family)